MRVLIAIAIVLLLMGFFGWVTFRNEGGDATLTIDKQKIKHDTEQVVEDGKELIRDARDAVTTTDRRDRNERNQDDVDIDVKVNEPVPLPMPE